jgi:hypothetical protein
MKPIHTSILCKYITLFDANEVIATPKYLWMVSQHKKNVLTTAQAIEVSIFADRLEIGYWIGGNPQWRVYRGDYDLVQVGPNDYDSDDFVRQQNKMLGLEPPAGKR